MKVTDDGQAASISYNYNHWKPRNSIQISTKHPTTTEIMLQITCQTGTSEHAATRERHVPATPLGVSHAQTGTDQFFFFFGGEWDTFRG